MARERAYPHDVRCRHCGSNWMPKNGHTRGLQVHKRSACKRKYTADAARPRFPEQVKRQAVQMRVGGASSGRKRSISEWMLKKGAIALERMRAISAWRVGGRNRCVNHSS